MSKVFRYADTHHSENTVSITLHHVDKNPQENYNRPCNEIVGAVITVNPFQKIFRYADTPSDNTLSITLYLVDTHPHEKSSK